jgi:hypothetical protein
MLKLTYSEFGLLIEQIGESLDRWVTQRNLLALSIGEPLSIQAGNASFLVPTEAVTANLDLYRIIRPLSPISLCCVDEDYYEVNIAGVWIAKNTHASEGILAADLGDLAESFVWRLWESSQKTYSNQAPVTNS